MTGINDIHEFTQFMQGAIVNTVPPRLHSRLNAPDAPPHDPSTGFEDARAPVNLQMEVEKRLQAAYESGGITKWSEQVLVEFQREWEGRDSECTDVYKTETGNK